MKFRFLTFLFISWLLPALIQAGQGDVPITATDTSSDAGTRESTKTLKMVYKGEERTAKLQIPSDNYQQNEPKWSGNGVNGSPGSLTATFQGSSSAMAAIHSDYPERDGEVDIELVPEAEKEISLSADKNWIKTITTTVNSWMSGYKEVPFFTLTGSLEGFHKKVDFYNDGNQIGSNFKLQGSIEGNLPVLELKTQPVYCIPAVPGFYLQGTVQVNAITGKISSNIAFDESKQEPWLNQECSISLSTSAKAILAAGFGIPDDASIAVELSGTASITASGSLLIEDKTAYAQWGIQGNAMVFAAEVVMTFIDLSVKIGIAEIECGEFEPVPQQKSYLIGPQ